MPTFVYDTVLMDRFIAWMKAKPSTIDSFVTGPTRVAYSEWTRIAEQYGVELYSTTTQSRHTREGAIHDFRFGVASIKETAQ
jgi:hypothetical protein